MKLALVFALAFGSSAQSATLVVRADRVHLGDGEVLAPGAVLVEDGRITWIGAPSSAPKRPDARELRCTDLLPGLVAWRRDADPQDAATADPGRLAADLPGPPDDDEALLDRGVTRLAVSPGLHRLVAGRAALVRLRGGGRRVADVSEGALVASLLPEALDPPPIFEPVLRVNADNPLPPARLQRPATPMAASAELRRLLASPGVPWLDVRAGAVPLAIHARAESEITRALALARDSGARLVIVGGDEAWKLASALGAARALVVLESAPPADVLQRGLDARADAATLLHAAGVAVALAAPSAPLADPLLLAARAVREGLPRAAAIAGVTGLAARSAGGVARMQPGAPADLAGFDGDPLAAQALPAFVVSGGVLMREAAAAPGPDDEDDALLALRVTRALDSERSVEPATILLRGARIVSVLPGGALPSGIPVHDFGAGSVAVPGFIDAFSRTGLEPGASPGGSARVRAQDALEPEHPSFARALRSGVTSALAVPATRGNVLGAASSVGMLARTVPIATDADALDDTLPPGRLIPDVIAAEAGLVTWIDDGPADDGPRQPRLKTLREILQRAKAYHESWLKAEKKPEETKGRKARAKPAADKPEKEPALEPWRPVLAGKAKCWLRCGREDLLLPALDAFKAVGITPILAGGEQADRVARELASRGVSVILALPALRREDGSTVNVAAELRAAGVPVAFGSFAPGAAQDLPSAVAGLVREGLAPADALAALTSTAAELAGLGETTGRLEAGSRADLVVFEGDPMEPSSRVIAVIARGKIAWRADEAASVAGGDSR